MIVLVLLARVERHVCSRMHMHTRVYVTEKKLHVHGHSHNVMHMPVTCVVVQLQACRPLFISGRGRQSTTKHHSPTPDPTPAGGHSPQPQCRASTPASKPAQPGACGCAGPVSPLGQQPNTSQALTSHSPRKNPAGQHRRRHQAGLQKPILTAQDSAEPHLQRHSAGQGTDSDTRKREQQKHTGLSLPNFVSVDTGNANSELRSTGLSSNRTRVSNRHT